MINDIFADDGLDDVLQKVLKLNMFIDAFTTIA